MQKGFVIFYITILVLAATLAMSGSMYLITFSNQKTAKNIMLSAQAEYTAESGIEDAIYRIKNLLPYSPSYIVSIGSSQASVTVAANGNSRTIESGGQQQNRTRKLQAILTVSTTSVSFYYGIQTGSQGIDLGNGSTIVGNVFSNGNIQGSSMSQSTITGTAQAAGSSMIKNITVNGNAYADHLSNCSVGGTLSYVTTISSCSAGSTVHVLQQLEPQNFPLSQSQIDLWKADATTGGTISSYSVGNQASASLGPKKINGNITLGNGSTLTLTGTVWVTGTIQFGNNDIIQLDPSYGAASGVLILDGSANVGNGAIFQGSGQNESNLMVLSTATGAALDIGNSLVADIFYAPNGMIEIGNDLNANEITGNGLEVGTGATITYQTGLANINFSSGPGGTFQVNSWKEIQ